MSIRELKKLKDRLYAGIPAEARRLREQAEKEGRELNAPEIVAIEKLAKERDEALAEITRLEQTETLEAPAPPSSAMLPAGSPWAPPPARPAIAAEPVRPPLPGLANGPRSWQTLFGAADEPATDPGEVISAFLSGLYHPAMEASYGGATPSAGGLLVPQVISEAIGNALIENSFFMSRATLWPMTSDNLKVPGVDAFDVSTGLPGGLTLEWLAENTDATAQTGKFYSVNLQPKKGVILARASNELVADAPSFERYISTNVPAAGAWNLDHAFLNGTGAGQPLGVLADPALVTVTKETAQEAATIVFENVAKMAARLHPACWSRAVWLVNPDVLPQLLTMYVGTGASGQLQPAVTSNGVDYTLMSRPVVFSEKAPTLGTKGDILLLDPTQYYIGLRQDFVLDRSQHLGFASDSTYFRLVCRVDGCGSWRTYYTPKNGSTKSWAVALATRA